MDKNIGKAIQRAVQSKKYLKRIQLVDVSEYQNYLVGEIIRYVLVFKEESGLEDYIIKLIKAMESNKTIQELNMIRDTTYASKIVTMITKRKHKITQEELNEKVFDYMYKNLITYGYVFHAFNGKLEKSILKNGLDLTKKNWEDIKIERVDNVLKKYGVVNAFWDYKMFSKEGISFTSKFTSIYNYAKMSPAFLTNFILNINKEDGKLAIYNKDIVRIKEIVLNYLDKNKITGEDKDIVYSFIEENLDEYIIEDSEYVALVERNNIEFLKGMYISYSKYLEITNEQDPDEYSIVSYILKVQDEFNDFKLKDKIKKDDVILINLPDYKASKLNIEKETKKEVIEEKVETVEEIKEDKKESRKVIKINGDILFGYVKIKTSLNKIKQDYLDSLTMENIEEEKDDHVLTFASLNDKKEEEKDDHVLTFASLNDKKEEEKDDHVLTFASLNDKKEEEKIEVEEKAKEDLEKSKMMDEFANADEEIDILARIEEQIKNSETAKEVEEVKEEKPEIEVEEIKENTENIAEEIVVEKVIVEKITKKYKVQSKKVKLKKKGELTSKEKIDLAIERAQRRKQEEEELKEENENLLKLELENIEKFAMNIIDEISEKVEKEIEIVKNTKIFKEDMTKEELDEFNQSVIDKICASNIDEDVVEEKIKDYNPIEEYEKKIANMQIENEDFEIENEYDPIAEYEKQLDLEKEEEKNSTQAQLEALFTPIVEEEINKVENEEIAENLEVAETTQPLEIVDSEKTLETSVPIIEEDVIEVKETASTAIKDIIDEKEESPVVEDKNIIPITILKEEVLEDKQVFNIEEDTEEFSENTNEDVEVEDVSEKKYKGMHFPKFPKTELKPETKKVIDKIKEKTLSFITIKEEEDFDNEMESLDDNIEEPLIIESVKEEPVEEPLIIESVKEEPIEEPIKEVIKENKVEEELDDLEYRKLEVCNADDIDVSQYLKNVISKKNYEEDTTENVEELKEKQEVIDKILDKKIIEEVKEENIAENIVENIEEVKEENTEQNIEELEVNNSSFGVVESLDNTEECKREEINIENEEGSLQTEGINEISEEAKKELSEEEIMKLIQEDELFMDEPQYVKKENPYAQKYKDIIPNDMETSLIVKTTLMESFKLALKEFTRKIVTNFATTMDEEDYENRNSKKQRIRRSPRLNEFGTYNDYKKVNKIDRVVNLMDDKSLRESRPRLTKEEKNEMIRNEKESFIENLYKEININSVNNSIYNK